MRGKHGLLIRKKSHITATEFKRCALHVHIPNENMRHDSNTLSGLSKIRDE